MEAMGKARNASIQGMTRSRSAAATALKPTDAPLRGV